MINTDTENRFASQAKMPNSLSESERRQPLRGWREAALPSAAAAHLQQKPTNAVTKLNLLQQLM